MSAWSEWQAGFITTNEYNRIMWEEEQRDRDYLVPDEPDEDYEEWDDEDDE